MTLRASAFSLSLDPLLPVPWLAGMAAIGIVVLGLALWKNRRGALPRAVAFSAFMLALLNPSVIEEKRDPVRDVAVIVVDRSQSQDISGRQERTDAALAHLQAALGSREDLELRIVEAPGADDEPANETALFSAVDQAFSDVPERRRAGVIMITDGQVHDAPADPGNAASFGPLHVLLTGAHNERDRQITILQSPGYGIVGQSVTARIRVEDTSNTGTGHASLTISMPDLEPEIHTVPIGTDYEIPLPVRHAGQNVYEIATPVLDGEITAGNNRSALIVNGVRDRLRVLLISGQPYAGARTWRDMLTSDPGVDLVHFTILRDPEKLDATPQSELSLIAFPVAELFETKLYDFDLIIFDRYHLNRVLPDRYFSNIARYVEEGGALLEASGPSFAGDGSLYFTGLMNVLPGTPTGDVLRGPFTPALTPDGRRHPVTRGLDGADDIPRWGRWLRQVALTPESGDTLMQGARENPLLILDRVGKGRVAQIASDQIWLWARGYEGGGPHAELLRRVVHWLMKEPELDEKALGVQISGNNVTLRSQDYRQTDQDITVTMPDGREEVLTLEASPDNTFSKRFKADQVGVYGFEDASGQRRFAVIGDINPRELRSLRSTADILQPTVKSSRGGIFWLSETPRPDVVHIGASGSYAGQGWLALRRNNDFTVTGTEDRPALPPEMMAALLLAITVFAWWREGRA